MPSTGTVFIDLDCHSRIKAEVDDVVAVAIADFKQIQRPILAVQKLWQIEESFRTAEDLDEVVCLR